ncbi:type II secretion system F family protein [Pararhodospirillum oryzae]|uniref:Type II secretion system protein n=1 Tax=Pararhodospirillum oryzae TaxID=478448 RepID=A0A512HC45_9PROT|nr:type II secretion system F family protein [Pararhodospirillum oryzae]GEO83022.1 type II secretion system protein [Pararhodospirillum oryzae]
MALFAYRALSARGRVLKGRLEARDGSDLYRMLHAAGLHLLGMREVRSSPGPLRAGTRGLLAALGPSRRPPARDLMQLCVHLERALAAGVPLLEVLADARAVTTHPTLIRVLEAVGRDVRQGVTLSGALGRHAAVLGPVVAPMVRAGEESGDLATAFRHLGRHLAWRDDTGRRLRQALRYPLLVLLLLGGVLAFLMEAVVPDLARFLADLGEGMPPQTRALIAFAHAWGEGGGLLGLLVLAGGLAGLGAARRASPGLAYRLDALWLGVPLLGPITRRLALARFAHVFSLLFQAGVPLATCLETARAVLGNRCLAEALDTAGRAVTAGVPLSESLRLTGQFPPLVWRMVRVGEDGGDLAGALAQVGAFHDRDVGEATDRLLALAGPAVLGCAGLLLGWIIWAVLMPIYDALAVLGT